MSVWITKVCPVCNREVSFRRKPPSKTPTFCSPSCRATRHGGEKTRLYAIWLGLKTRCYNSLRREYFTYGAKGITVCDEWRHSFANFRDWSLANGYDDSKELHRIESGESYVPDNCEWLTESEHMLKHGRIMVKKGLAHA